MNLISNWQEKKDMFSKYSSVQSVKIYGNESVKDEKYTIFIPTYKRSHLLKASLESAINQNVEFKYKIIVVDNANDIDDETDRIMRDYCSRYDNIVYYRNSENIGMFGNWNRGFELSKTEYVTMLHDDDLLYKEYLSAINKTVNKKEAGIIGVFSMFMEDAEGEMVETQKCQSQNKMKRIISNISHGKPLRINIYDNYRSITVTPTACSFRRTDIINCGGFNEDYFPIADIIMFNKLTYLCGAIIIPQFLAIRRIGENEMKNVLADCTKKSAIYHRDLHSKIYRGKRKKWIAEYASAVNHLIFLSKKYDTKIDVDKILEDNNLSKLWNKIPNVILKLILGCFWIRLILKNAIIEKKNG